MNLETLIPLVGAVVAWFVNERRKRAWEEYQKKEENYKELIRALKGFSASWDKAESKELKNKFIDQMNLCWLYSPDEVIRSGYAFLRTVKTGEAHSEEEKQRALGHLMLTIRKDLLSRTISKKTQLTASDYEHYIST